MRTMLSTFLLMAVFLLSSSVSAEPGRTEWPEPRLEQKPGVRWWWLGSAVDTANLSWNLDFLSEVGVGSVEITPIYGVQGHDAMEIDYLSPKWMKMFQHTHTKAVDNGILVDMNGGTGWPFGGPEIQSNYAATKAITRVIDLKPSTQAQQISIAVEDARQASVATLEALLFVGSDGSRKRLSPEQCVGDVLTWKVDQEGKLYVLHAGKTLQQVKRAAPGGQGLVMDHLNREALDFYLSKFDAAFKADNVSWPHAFFNDSYEVYGADWSPVLVETFKKLRGYDLMDYIPELMGEGNEVIRRRVICDYRETVSDMLLDNFTKPWTEWAHERGIETRNQAHGSPGNLLDLYAAIDVPECESFGITTFDIPGFRVDDQHKESDSNPATLKYASSAAHVVGRKYTSAESMTWLTEHFRTSLFQIKPEMDQLFLNGINRVFYHGTPYTPKEAAWPGWLFYASIQVNPNNTVFRDMHALNAYATRVQSFLQAGKPDNEVLLYLPIHDIWQKWERGRYLTFDIHKMSEKLPDFEKIVFDIRRMGYDLDYISDRQLLNSTVADARIQTEGGSYKMVIVPDCSYMSLETAQKLSDLAANGAVIAFLNRLPEDVPGLFEWEKRKSQLQTLVNGFQLPAQAGALVNKAYQKGRLLYGADLEALLEAGACTREAVTTDFGAGFIRRRMDDGYVYFIAQQKNTPIQAWVPLGVSATSVQVFNPLTGQSGRAKTQIKGNKTHVFLNLKPGESILLRTFDQEKIKTAAYPWYEPLPSGGFELKGRWSFQFTEGTPAIPGIFEMRGHPHSWTELPVEKASIYAGVGVYRLHFEMPKNVRADEWLLDLGVVSESARIRINGQSVATVWSLPFQQYVGAYLKPGKTNVIELEVTNLPFNRIADYDRRGVNWRIFKEINFVDVNYKRTRYDSWATAPSGLTQPVRLQPYKQLK